MAQVSKVAARYAKAFVEYLADGKSIRSTVAELETFQNILNESQEFRSAVLTNIVPRKTRQVVVADIAEKLGVSSHTKRLLAVLAVAKRLDELADIARGMKELVLEREGVAPVLVETATELSAEQRQAIERKFESLLGKKVEASYEVATRILGGVRVTAGSRTFDGSLSGGLARLEEKLIGGSI